MARLLTRRRGLDDGSRAALRNVLADPIFELLPLRNIADQVPHLPPGARVSVTASPAKGIDATVDWAARLQADGFRAIPHLSARMIASRAVLAGLLERSRDAGLTHAFVVGGDADEQGEYLDGLSLLQAMTELGHPFTILGCPAYPQGHPDIPDAALAAALREHRSSHQRLGLVLVRQGIIDELELTKVLARQFRMPAVDLSRFEVDPRMLKLIPADLALKRMVLPLKREGRTLTVAMAEPTNSGLIEDLKFITRYDPSSEVVILFTGLDHSHSRMSGVNLDRSLSRGDHRDARRRSVERDVSGEIATRRHHNQRGRLYGTGSLEAKCVDRLSIVTGHCGRRPLMTGGRSQIAGADDHGVGARAQQSHQVAISSRASAQRR